MSPRLFLWVLALRPYSSGGGFIAFARPRGRERMEPFFLQKWKHPPPFEVNPHSWRHGLQGSLIPFAPHAFASQCQKRGRELPSHSAFLPGSTNFTSSPGIPLSSLFLKPNLSLFILGFPRNWKLWEMHLEGVTPRRCKPSRCKPSRCYT